MTHMRLMMTLAMTAGVGFHSTAQDPAAPELLEWKTTEGHTAQAAFHSADDDAGTVTVLVPKVLPIERLDAATREMLQELRSEPSTEAEPELVSEPMPEKDPEFMMLGSLSDPTVKEWKAATVEQQVATCGTMLYMAVIRNVGNDAMREATSTPARLNAEALELYAGVELLRMKLELDRPIEQVEALKISTMVATISDVKGWMKFNVRSVGQTIFSDLKVIQAGDDYALIGKVENMSSEDLQILTFHLNFENAGELADVQNLIIPGLKSKEVKTFKTSIPRLGFEPDLSQISITPSVDL